MCPTLCIYVGKRKKEMVIKEWKQIKIELMCGFQTFPWMAFVTICELFPLPKELVI